MPARILHGVWLPQDRLFVWGEDPTRLPRPHRLRAELGDAGHPPGSHHPFPLHRTALAAELRSRTHAETLSQLEAYDATLLLPTVQGYPVPSPPLAPRRDHSPEPGHEPLVPWEVRGYLAPEGAALAFLRASPFAVALAARRGPSPFPEASQPGESLAWLRALGRLALTLVHGGRLLPGIDPVAECRSRWLPLLTAPRDRARFEDLVAAIPGMVRAAPRALMRSRPAHPDDLPRAADIAAAALCALVDELARLHLADQALGRMLFRELPPRLPARPWLLDLADASLAGGGRAALAGLRGELAAWQARARDPLRARWRLALRVEAPPDEGGTWWVHPRLEPLTEGDAPRAVAALRQPGAEELWAFFRQELRRAARRLPELDPHPLEAGQEQLPLDLEAAHRLLATEAERLAEAGVRLEVPEWWLRRRRELRARARVAPVAGAQASRLGLETLCRVDWSAALGDDPLDAATLARLARAARPLVQVAGRWVELDAAQRAALRGLLEAQDQHPEDDLVPLARALRLQVGLEEVPGGLEGAEVTLEGALAEALGARAAARQVETPAGFGGQLRPYQARGVAWMEHLEALGLGACLADDMGLGKTVQVLALLAREGPVEGPGTLLVAPLSVLGNWAHEAARFVPDLRVAVHHGPERARGPALAELAAGHDMVLTSYGVLGRDAAELAALAWHRLVLDEAQNVKNPRTVQARAARGLGAPRRLALTGTPVENRLGELWALLHLLTPGLLGSERRFREQFVVPIERHRDPARTEALRTLVAPFMLRRTKRDPGLLPELPEKIEKTEHCPLTREQAALYQATTDEAMQTIEVTEGMERRGLVLRTLLRLKQVCNHPEQLLRGGGPLAGRSGKLARLEEIAVDAREAGERLLCFTQYREMGELLVARLHQRLGEEPAFYHGGVPRPARERLVARFQGGEGPGVMVVTVKAGGTGLNLTAARRVVHFDRWWNPAVEDQATDRVHRIGQIRDVLVQKLVTRGTLEEHIDRMLEEKRALGEAVVAGGEAWITELPVDELRRMLRLDTGALVADEEDA